MGIFFWFSLTLVLLVFEASTLGLMCIWFAAGALVTAIVSLYMDIIWVQWLIFALVSGLSLILVRPLIADKLNSKLEKTNIESIIGVKGKVEKKIDNFKLEHFDNGIAIYQSDNYYKFTQDAILLAKFCNIDIYIIFILSK